MSEMFDFPADVFEVNSETSNWGPCVFNLAPGMPSGVTITSVVVKSYFQGRETTSLLIASGYTTFTGTTVSVFFNYPGEHFVGSHEVHIIPTFSGVSSSYGFRFSYVVVQK